MTKDIAVLEEELRYLKEQEKVLFNSHEMRKWRRNLARQVKIIAMLEMCERESSNPPD